MKKVLAAAGLAFVLAASPALAAAPSRASDTPAVTTSPDDSAADPLKAKFKDQWEKLKLQQKDQRDALKAEQKEQRDKLKVEQKQQRDKLRLAQKELRHSSRDRQADASDIAPAPQKRSDPVPVRK